MTKLLVRVFIAFLGVLVTSGPGHAQNGQSQNIPQRGQVVGGAHEVESAVPTGSTPSRAIRSLRLSEDLYQLIRTDPKVAANLIRQQAIAQGAGSFDQTFLPSPTDFRIFHAGGSFVPEAGHHDFGAGSVSERMSQQGHSKCILFSFRGL